MHLSEFFALLNALNSPAVLLSLLVPVFLVLLAGSSATGLAARVRARSHAIVAGAAVLCVLSYTIYSIHYSMMAGCVDHLEPTVVSTMRLYGQGGPLYHGLPSASRYAMLYGPNTFIVPWLVTLLAGGSVMTLKLLSAGFALASLAVTILAMRAVTASRHARWCGLAYYCAGALLFREKLVWLRGDPQLLFWTAAGLWGATRKHPATAFAIVGLALGASLGLKAHAPLYFAPTVAIVAPRARPRDWAILIAGAALTAVAPFVFFKGVPLADYLRWLRLASRHGFSGTQALNNLLMMSYLILPASLAAAGWLGGLPVEARREFGRTHRVGLLAAGLALAALFVPASKLGGGDWHLLPWVPVAAWFFARALAPDDASHRLTPAAAPDRQLVLASFLVLAVLQCGIVLKQVAHELRVQAPEQQAVAADLRLVTEKYRGQRIAMGYGGDSTYVTTFARVGLRPTPEFVLDGGALMDMQESGLSLPGATLDAIRTGKVRLWLIPGGDEPFSMRNYYKKQDLFGPEMRSVFLQHYRRVDRSRFFDIWSFVGPSS